MASTHSGPALTHQLTRLSVVPLLAMFARLCAQATIQDEPTRLVLRNGQCTLVLEKAERRGIRSLRDNLTGQEFVPTGAIPSLFELSLTPTDTPEAKPQQFTSRDAEELTCSVAQTATGSVATLRFARLGGQEIQAVCTATLTNADPFVHWRISVHGTAAHTLEEVRFPIMALAKTLGTEDEDDVLVAGLNRGGMFRQPGNWPANASLTAYQPGRLAAQFACHYDHTAGTYTATQDSRGYPKQLSIRRTAAGLETAWEHLCFHALDVPWELPYDVVSTTLRGAGGAETTDWRDAADLYKEWARQQPWCARTFSQRDLPRWAKSGAPLLFCDLRSRWGNAASMTGIAEWIDRSWSRHFGDAPAPTVILFACEGLAAWSSPDYFPLYPSDEAFKRGAEALHRVGAHVYFAPSSYQWWLTYGKRPEGGFLWDGREDFKRTAQAHAVIRRDGTPYSQRSSWLENGETANLCHGDAWSREWFVRLAEGLRDRGGDILHLDQAVSGRWPQGGIRNVCYSRDHGHSPGHGLWETQAMQDQLTALQQRVPEVVIAGFEEPQELFIQHCAMQFHDGWHPWSNADQPGHAPAPVMEYLYHEYLPLYAHLGGSLDRLECIADAAVNGNVLQYRPALHGMPGELVLAGGDFEEWNDDATPVHWQNMKVPMGQIWRYTGTVARDPQEKHGGTASLRLEGTKTTSAAVRRHVHPLSKEMADGKAYRLRAWLKSTAPVKGAISVRVEYTARSPESWTLDIAQATDWTEKQLSFALGEGARTLEILVTVDKQQATVWYDDLVLEETPAGGEAKVALWPETPQNRIYRQWARLFSGAGRPYLLMGEMLRPPPLATDKVQCSFWQTRRVSVSRRVPIHFQNAHGRIFHSAYIPIGPEDVKEWTKREVTFTVPEQAARCTVFLYLSDKGDLWFDDLALTEVGQEQNLLPNGTFEDWDDQSRAPADWRSPTNKRDHGVEEANAPQRDEKNAHGGKLAVHLANSADGQWSEANHTLSVGPGGLAAGKTYRLSLWLKARGVGPWRREPKAEIPAILHNAFRAPDGSEAVILVNITDRPQTGQLTWDGKQTELTLSPWEVKLVPQAR